MSNAKLGLLTFWPTFWTGFPVKMVMCLLLLAAHIHPWEGTGLFILLLVSIPVDIWALGLCARTVSIDRLGIDPAPGFGLQLWIRWAAFSAVVLPLISMAVSSVKAGAKSATSSIVESIKEHIYPTLPVAEQITLELVMWGSVATIALLALLYVWFYGLGWMMQGFVRAGTPVGGNIETRTNFWDQLRIPSDQPLLLVAFTGAGVLLVFVFWGLIPSSTPHPHQDYEFSNPAPKVVIIDPKHVLSETEKLLAKAGLVVEKLQEEKAAAGEAGEKNGDQAVKVQKEANKQSGASIAEKEKINKQ